MVTLEYDKRLTYVRLARVSHRPCHKHSHLIGYFPTKTYTERCTTKGLGSPGHLIGVQQVGHRSRNFIGTPPLRRYFFVLAQKARNAGLIGLRKQHWDHSSIAL